MNMRYDLNRKYVSALTRTPATLTIATLKMMAIKNLFEMAFEFGIAFGVLIWKLFHSIQTKDKFIFIQYFIQNRGPIGLVICLKKKTIV